MIISVQSAVGESPYFQGWLYKRGEVNQSWKRRFFVLKDDSLAYYKHARGSKAKGVIPLSNATIDTSDERLYSKFGFQLFPAGSSRVYTIHAAFEDELVDWLRAIFGATVWAARREGRPLPPPLVLPERQLPASATTTAGTPGSPGMTLPGSSSSSAALSGAVGLAALTAAGPSGLFDPAVPVSGAHARASAAAAAAGPAVDPRSGWVDDYDTAAEAVARRQRRRAARVVAAQRARARSAATAAAAATAHEAADAAAAGIAAAGAARGTRQIDALMKPFSPAGTGGGSAAAAAAAAAAVAAAADEETRWGDDGDDDAAGADNDDGHGYADDASDGESDLEALALHRPRPAPIALEPGPVARRLALLGSVPALGAAAAWRGAHTLSLGGNALAHEVDVYRLPRTQRLGAVAAAAQHDTHDLWAVGGAAGAPNAHVAALRLLPQHLAEQAGMGGARGADAAPGVAAAAASIGAAAGGAGAGGRSAPRSSVASGIWGTMPQGVSITPPSALPHATLRSLPPATSLPIRSPAAAVADAAARAAALISSAANPLAPRSASSAAAAASAAAAMGRFSLDSFPRQVAQLSVPSRATLALPEDRGLSQRHAQAIVKGLAGDPYVPSAASSVSWVRDRMVVATASGSLMLFDAKASAYGYSPLVAAAGAAAAAGGDGDDDEDGNDDAGTREDAGASFAAYTSVSAFAEAPAGLRLAGDAAAEAAADVAHDSHTAGGDDGPATRSTPRASFAARSALLGMGAPAAPTQLRLASVFTVPPPAGKGSGAGAGAGVCGDWAPAARGPLVAVNPLDPLEFATASGALVSSWSMSSDVPICSEIASSSPVTALAWAAEGSSTLLMGSARGTLKLVDMRLLPSSPQESVTFAHAAAHSGPVTAVACSPLVPTLVASAGLDGGICVWDVRFDRCPIARLTSQTPSPALSLAWSRAHPELLLSGQLDGSLALWSLAAAPHRLVYTASSAASGAPVVSVGWSTSSPGAMVAIDSAGAMSAHVMRPRAMAELWRAGADAADDVFGGFGLPLPSALGLVPHSAAATGMDAAAAVAARAARTSIDAESGPAAAAAASLAAPGGALSASGAHDLPGFKALAPAPAPAPAPSAPGAEAGSPSAPAGGLPPTPAGAQTSASPTPAPAAAAGSAAGSAAASPLLAAVASPSAGSAAPGSPALGAAAGPSASAAQPTPLAPDVSVTLVRATVAPPLPTTAALAETGPSPALAGTLAAGRAGTQLGVGNSRLLGSSAGAGSESEAALVGAERLLSLLLYLRDFHGAARVLCALADAHWQMGATAHVQRLLSVTTPVLFESALSRPPWAAALGPHDAGVLAALRGRRRPADTEAARKLTALSPAAEAVLRTRIDRACGLWTSALAHSPAPGVARLTWVDTAAAARLNVLKLRLTLAHLVRRQRWVEVLALQEEVCAHLTSAARTGDLRRRRALLRRRRGLYARRFRHSGMSEADAARAATTKVDTEDAARVEAADAEELEALERETATMDAAASSSGLPALRFMGGLVGALRRLGGPKARAAAAADEDEDEDEDGSTSAAALATFDSHLLCQLVSTALAFDHVKGVELALALGHALKRANSFALFVPVATLVFAPMVCYVGHGLGDGSEPFMHALASPVADAYSLAGGEVDADEDEDEEDEEEDDNDDHDEEHADTDNVAASPTPAAAAAANEDAARSPDAAAGAGTGGAVPRRRKHVRGPSMDASSGVLAAAAAQTLAAAAVATAGTGANTGAGVGAGKGAGAGARGSAAGTREPSRSGVADGDENDPDALAEEGSGPEAEQEEANEDDIFFDPERERAQLRSRRRAAAAATAAASAARNRTQARLTPADRRQRLQRLSDRELRTPRLVLDQLALLHDIFVAVSNAEDALSAATYSHSPSAGADGIDDVDNGDAALAALRAGRAAAAAAGAPSRGHPGYLPNWNPWRVVTHTLPLRAGAAPGEEETVVRVIKCAGVADIYCPPPGVRVTVSVAPPRSLLRCVLPPLSPRGARSIVKSVDSGADLGELLPGMALRLYTHALAGLQQYDKALITAARACAANAGFAFSRALERQIDLDVTPRFVRFVQSHLQRQDRAPGDCAHVVMLCFTLSHTIFNAERLPPLLQQNLAAFFKGLAAELTTALLAIAIDPAYAPTVAPDASRSAVARAKVAEARLKSEQFLQQLQRIRRERKVTFTPWEPTFNGLVQTLQGLVARFSSM